MADIGVRLVILGLAEFRRGISSAQSDVSSMEKAIRTVSGTGKEIGTTMTNVGNAITGVGRSLSLFVTGPILALSGSLLAAGIQFEDAFAGVTKTIDDLADPMGELTVAGKDLREQFVELSETIPVTAVDLAHLGQISGQFGESKETVIDMVKTLAMLRESTDLTAEAQQQAFAQIAKVTGLASDEYDNMASSLVFLGNNFPTTESRIVAFTERISGTAAAFGVAISQTLAWGAAITSSGIQAETGATAMRKAWLEMALAAKTGGDGVLDLSSDIGEAQEKIERLGQRIAVTNQRISEFTENTHESTKMAADFSLQNMNEDLATQQELLEGLNDINGKVFSGGSAELQQFAAVAQQALSSTNLSIEEFANKFKLSLDVLKDGQISAKEFGDAFRNDASKSLQLFIEGLSKMDAIDQIAALDALGLSAQRVGSVLQNLAANTDLVAEALDGSAQAFAEGTALQEEFTKRTATVKSDLQILKNQFIALGITMFNLFRDDLRNLIEGIGTLVDRFTALDPATQKMIALILGIAAAIGPLLIIIGSFISALGVVITALAGVIANFAIIGPAVLIAGGAFALFGPMAIQAVQPVIDKVKELIGIIMGVPQVPDVGGGNIEDAGRTRHEGGTGDIVVPSTALPDPTLIERIQAAFDNLRESIHIPPEIINTFNELRAAIATFGTVASDVFNSVITTIKTTLGPSFTQVFDSLTETLHKFGLDWGDVWNAVKTVIVIAIEVIGAIIIGLIGVILGVVNGIASGLNTLITFFGSLQPLLEQFVHGWIQAFAGLTIFFEGVFNLLGGIVDFFVGRFTGNTELVQSAVARMGQGIRQEIIGIGTFFVGLSEQGTAALGILVSGFVGFIGTVLSIVTGFIGAMLTFFGEFWAQLTGDTNNALLQIANWFLTATTTITAGVAAFVSAIVGFFQMLFDTLVGGSIVPDLVAAVISKLKEMADSVLGDIGDFVSSFITKITELKDEIIKIIMQMQKDVGAKIKSMGDDMSNAMGTAAKAIFKVRDAFQALLDWLKSNAEKLITIAGAVSGAIGGIQADNTESPELKIQHSFERWEKMMNQNSLVDSIKAINDSLTGVNSNTNDQLLSSLNGINAPAQSVSNITTDNSVSTNITGVPIQNQNDLASLIDQRVRVARGRA